MRILHIAAPAAVGGLERVVEGLCRGLAERDHEVHLALVVDPGQSARHLFPALAESNVHIHTLELPGRAYLRERRMISALVQQLRPQVAHTHGYRPDVVDAPVARRLGCASVTTVHGFTGQGWRGRLYERLQLRAFKSFDAVIAVSRPLAALLARRGIPEQRVRLIPNAWPGSERPPLPRADARRRLGIPESQTVVGWVGRLSHEKAADVFLESAAASVAGIHFSVVGDGRERGALLARAEELRLQDRVRWHGAIPDAGSLLAAFDVFVLSSRSEGTPIVLFEAMAAGVPIVATRVGGVPDVVDDDCTLLVASEAPDQVRAAIDNALRDPAAAKRRADLARRRLRERFATTPWIDRHESLYRDLTT